MSIRGIIVSVRTAGDIFIARKYHRLALTVAIVLILQDLGQSLALGLALHDGPNLQAGQGSGIPTETAVGVAAVPTDEVMAFHVALAGDLANAGRLLAAYDALVAGVGAAVGALVLDGEAHVDDRRSGKEVVRDGCGRRRMRNQRQFDGSPC